MLCVGWSMSHCRVDQRRALRQHAVGEAVVERGTHLACVALPRPGTCRRGMPTARRRTTPCWPSRAPSRRGRSATLFVQVLLAPAEQVQRGGEREACGWSCRGKIDTPMPVAKARCRGSRLASASSAAATFRTRFNSSGVCPRSAAGPSGSGPLQRRDDLVDQGPDLLIFASRIPQRPGPSGPHTQAHAGAATTEIMKAPTVGADDARSMKARVEEADVAGQLDPSTPNLV